MDTKFRNFDVVTLKSWGMSRHQFRPSLSIGLEPSDNTPCEDQHAKETSNPFQTPIFDLHHSPASYNSTRVSQVSDFPLSPGCLEKFCRLALFDRHFVYPSIPRAYTSYLHAW
jgi:hypothetical protein